MTFVQIYDAVVRVFRWPVIANAVLSAIVMPVILATGIVPPEALTEWTWISAGLSGALFVLVTVDMRNQRAIWVFNAMAREDSAENGYGSRWGRPIGQDRIASILLKIMFVEYAMLIFANMTLAIHLFAALFGLGCLIMTSIKYDPDVQEKLAADTPGQTSPSLPGERTMAHLWLFAGLAGIGLTAIVAVACFAFGLNFYYHFGPHYGEEVPPHILATILGGLTLAFAFLAFRGWLSLRKTGAPVARPE